MCRICDGDTMEDLHRDTQRLIAEGRWSLMAVTDHRPWTYTIGLADHGLPELVMLGPNRRAAKVLDDLAGQLLAGLGLEVGTRVTANGEHLLIGAVHRDHVERGLVATWVAFHEWAGLPMRMQLFQVLTESDGPHPVLSARSLASARNLLGL